VCSTSGFERRRPAASLLAAAPIRVPWTPQGLHADAAHVRSQTALGVKAEDPDVEAAPVGVPEVVENHTLRDGAP
jgi:hypothetical protein